MYSPPACSVAYARLGVMACAVCANRKLMSLADLDASTSFGSLLVPLRSIARKGKVDLITECAGVFFARGRASALPTGLTLAPPPWPPSGVALSESADDAGFSVYPGVTR